MPVAWSPRGDSDDLRGRGEGRDALVGVAPAPLLLLRRRRNRRRDHGAMRVSRSISEIRTAEFFLLLSFAFFISLSLSTPTQFHEFTVVVLFK